MSGQMDEIIQLYHGPMARPIGYCTEGPFKGWIFAKHPDGQWVSLAKIPEPEPIPEAKPDPRPVKLRAQASHDTWGCEVLIWDEENNTSQTLQCSEKEGEEIAFRINSFNREVTPNPTPRQKARVQAPEDLTDLVADLMRKHGPDGHIDGHETIAQGAWDWMRNNEEDVYHG